MTLSPTQQWSLIARWWDGIASTIERNGLDGLAEAEREAMSARLQAEILTHPEDTANRRERIAGLMEAWA